MSPGNCFDSAFPELDLEYRKSKIFSLSLTPKTIIEISQKTLENHTIFISYHIKTEMIEIIIILTHWIKISRISWRFVNAFSAHNMFLISGQIRIKILNWNSYRFQERILPLFILILWITEINYLQSSVIYIVFVLIVMQSLCPKPKRTVNFDTSKKKK